jgi:hypothetical protein
MQKTELNSNINLHPDYLSWDNYLKNYTHYNGSYNNFKIYNATNCWYLVNNDIVYYDIFGYNVWRTLQELAGGNIGNIRDMFDSFLEFKNNASDLKWISDIKA